MPHIFDEWNFSLNTLKTSLALVGYFPHEVTYEIQNALVHLLFALKSLPIDRRKEIKRAIAHIRRANFDALKIRLFEIHNNLVKQQQSTNCDKAIEFQKRFTQTRLAELQSVGALHHEILTDFQKVIEEFSIQSSSSQPTWHLQPTAVAQTYENYHICRSTCCDLFWQWAQLEILLTSLYGQRVYDVSYNIINAYLRWENFLEELQKIIPTLKVAIILILVRNDCNHSLSTMLCGFPDGDDFLKMKDFIIENPTLKKSDIDKLYQHMASMATSLFPHILKFLGVSFEESLSIVP